MARYIDAEHFRDRVKTATNPYGKPTIDYESGLKVLRMIDQEPTVDIAPQSEFEQLKKKYDLAVAEREANVKGFTETVSRVKSETINEIADLLTELMINGECEIYIDTEIAQEIIDIVRAQGGAKK